MRAAQVEGHMVVRPAGHVEVERVRELALVVVGGAEPGEHLVALLDPLAAELHVLGGGAAEVHRDGAPAQHFLHRPLHELVVAVDAGLAQLPEGFRPLGQGLQPRRHGVAAGVVAGRDHQHEQVLELQVGEALAVDGRRQQRSDEVLARALATVLRLALGVLVQLQRGGRAERDVLELVGVGEPHRPVGHLGVEVAEQRVALLHQPVAVVVGHAEHAAEHLHRQPLGHTVHIVEPVAQLTGLQHHGASQVADAVLVAVHLAAAEGLADQAAVAGVLRRVVLQHVAAEVEVLALDLLQRHALSAAEQLHMLADIQQVLVAGDRPEALAAVVLLPPADRVLVAQPLERGVREAVQVAVRVDDVQVVGAEVHVQVGRGAHVRRPPGSCRRRMWCRRCGSSHRGPHGPRAG